MRPLFALLALGVASCAPVPRLTPIAGAAGGDAPVFARDVEIRALPNAWRGYPTWLTRRFTPIWVYLINRGDQSFAVTYGSLALVDERGEVYPAIPPSLVAREILGSGEAPPELLLAQARPEEPAPTPEPPPRPSLTPAPPPDTVYYGLAPYEFVAQPFSPGHDSGRTPFGYSPPFSPFGPLGIGREAGDVVVPALREGRLLPGTRAEGFVYFRRAPGAARLDLILSARNERHGGPPLEAKLPFSAR